MKLVAQNYRSGDLEVLDVPAPACKPGGVLVRTLYSLISTGTEMMKVKEAKLSLVSKARSRPDQVRQVLESAAQLGPVAAYKKAASRLDSLTPLGYSLCGEVIEVGRDAEEFVVGQLVACAGNEYALHGEVNWIPTNLCVPVPADVPADLAGFATVGAIAMHGMRRAEVQLGDSACVIGLGLVGQLLVQLLVASGVRVVGVDIVDDRCRQAERSGALACAAPTTAGLELIAQRVAKLTSGAGVDHVFLTAGGSSDEPVHIAARLARDRARVVDIGKCRLDLPWNAYYEKELDVRFSRSYGPGRYDDRYEVEGVDYPIGYVRWTERRNLACFLDLIACDRLNLEQLVSGVFPIDEAAAVYERLERGELQGVGFLFEYPTARPAATPNRAVPPLPVRSIRSATTVRVGFIGAGNYATSMLLPHLAKDDRVSLEHVATSSSLSGVNAQRRFGFARVSTDADAVLEDPDIDAVFVVTRHHSHAEFVGRALERGKAVFVEKPLALSFDELAEVLRVVATTGNDRLMVGFNRRFAPLLTELKQTFGRRTSAGVLRYGVHAGRLGAGSWYANGELEGSRFVGEGGHFIDTLGWWVDGLPTEVYAMRGHTADDVQVTLRFDEGSTAAIGYATGGNSRYPKEILEVSGDGCTARLDNFKATTLWSGRRRRTRRARMIDKGQRVQLARFLDAVRHEQPMPISLVSLAATTKATLAVARSLSTGLPERL